MQYFSYLSIALYPSLFLQTKGKKWERKGEMYMKKERKGYLNQ